MHAISANCLLVTGKQLWEPTLGAPVGSWLGVCQRLLLVQHVGSRFCHGAVVCFADVQWLTQAAVLCDHHRQHSNLLLLEGYPILQQYLMQNLVPSQLVGSFWDRGEKEQPRSWW